MSSACEVVNVSGFESKLNRRRLEVDWQECEGFYIGSRVNVSKPGLKSGKVHRFVFDGHQYCADVEFKLSFLKFLKMIPIDLLSFVDNQREQSLNLTRRRNEALPTTGPTGLAL